MAAVPKRLVGVAVATASTTQYTVPASTTTIIKNILICNTSASSTTLWMVAGGINILSNLVVAPSDTVILDLSTILSTGQTIVTTASATGIHLTISGVEVV